MKSFLNLLAACLAVSFISNRAYADEFLVGPTREYTTIQAGIDAASGGDTVTVDNGTYTEHSISFNGKIITVQSAGGASNCTIDVADTSDKRAFLFNGNETSSAKLIGFTIKRGNMTGSADGGAIKCDGASPTIQDCVIRESRAAGRGGGIYCVNGASPTITGCDFYANSAGGAGAGVGNGGAIACFGAGTDPVITDCIIGSNDMGENNAADNDGGGIWIDNGAQPSVSDCIIVANGAGSRGGGISITGGGQDSVTVSHCYLFDNSTTSNGGGGMNVNNSTLALVNCLLETNEAGSNGGGARVANGATLSVLACTVYGNQTKDGDSGSGNGGGLWVEGNGSTLKVYNSILWANDDSSSGTSGNNQIDFTNTPTIDVRHSDVDGGYSGTNNLDTDPSLQPESGGGVLGGLHIHLSGGSDVIDQGDETLSVTWSLDIDGETRVQGDDVDMGIDEVE